MTDWLLPVRHVATQQVGCCADCAGVQAFGGGFIGATTPVTPSDPGAGPGSGGGFGTTTGTTTTTVTVTGSTFTTTPTTTASTTNGGGPVIINGNPLQVNID